MLILDINIQFGKFFSPASGNDGFFKVIIPILSILLSGLISTGIAILVFRLNKKKDKEKEDQRISDVRKYFFVCLMKFRIGINKQIEDFDKIIELLESDVKDSVSVFRRTSINYSASPKQLESISKNDTFNFFILNRNDNETDRIKKYTNFYDTLELIEKIIIQMEEGNKEFGKYFENAAKIINDNRNYIRNSIYTKVHESRTNGGIGILDTYFNLMAKAYQNYIDTKNKTIDLIMKDLIFPIKKESEKSFSHPNSKEILDFCMTAESAHYQYIQRKGTIQLENFKHWKQCYIGMQVTITSMIEIEFKDLKQLETIFLTEEDKSHEQKPSEVSL